MSETSHEKTPSLWTSSAEDSPVKTSPPPDYRPGWTVRDPAFSMRCRGSFATLDQKSGLWKTSQTSFLSGFQTFSERWPTAGIMRGGDVFEHPTWEHHTTGIDGFVLPGTWPTPQKFDGYYMNKNLEWYDERVKIYPKAQPCMQVEAQRYSTPDLREKNGQHINPEWVEMLMGFPPGWTSLDIGGQPHQGHSPQESLPGSITNNPQTNKD